MRIIYEKPELESALFYAEKGYGESESSFGVESMTEVEGEW